MREMVPAEILERVSRAVPQQCLKNMIVIGSLAVGYHFRASRTRPVRTKDIDCMLYPRQEAVVSAQALAEQLLAEGWAHRTEWGWGKPQNQPEPRDGLSGVRLIPPDEEPLNRPGFSRCRARASCERCCGEY